MTTKFLASDITRDEGCVLRAYQDSGGVWTIGVGHTGPEVHPGLIWSQTQADAQLSKDIVRAQTALSLHMPWWKRLNDARQDVLVNMVFNLGIDGVLAFHHTISALEGSAYEVAASDMLLTQPWHRQIGDRCDRLAAQMRTGFRNALEPA